MTDLEEKQDYLRTNIVELNYDPSEFLEYLIKNHGEDAPDLEKFTIDELADIVIDFQKTHLVKPEEETEEIKDEHMEESKITEENQSNSQNKLTLIEETIKITKLEVTPLLNKEINVLLSKPEKKEGGIFSKSYITYLITVKSLNLEVRRRYSDFEWLRSILLSNFPASWIPPIPIKSYSDRFDNEFIEKRMRYLQKFIDSIVDSPNLVNSIYFYDFISNEKDADFNNKKKLHSKAKVPLKISEMRNVEGEISIKLSNEDIKEFDKIKFTQNFTESIIEKLSNSVRMLNLEMIAVSNRMQEISDSFEQLTIVSVRTNDNKITTDTYKTLRKIIRDWGTSYIQQKELIDSDIREYLNYIKREFISLKEVRLIYKY